MSRYVDPVPQYWLNDGTLAVSGKFKFFENRDYSTLKDTYSQADNTVPNTNPVTLDGQGRFPPCFGTGLYSVKFYAYDNAAPDKLGTLQWTRDDVSLSELTGQFSTWSPLTTYLSQDIVRGSNGKYYRSLAGANIGNDPTTATTWWELVVFITEYNANRTYQIGDPVISAGLLYACNTAGLIGNAPPSAQWTNLTFNGTYVGNLVVTGSITGASYVGGSLSKTTDTGINFVAKKTGSTNRISTTTLANDPDLIISGLLASTWYAFKAVIQWSNNGSTTNGIKVRVAATSGATYSQIFIANTNTSSANSDPTANEIGGVPSGFSKLPNTAGASETIVIEGVIQTILATDIHVEWAQAASIATNTTVGAGSYLTVMKL